MAIHARGGRRSVWQAIRFAIAVGRRLVRERFDVVDVQNMAPLSCLTVLVATKMTGTTPIITWHEVWRGYWFAYMGWLGHLGRLAEWLVARWAPHQLAVSQTTIRHLRAMGVADAGWVPNGVDCSKIASVPPSLLISDVVSVGRLVDHKNIELLLDAAALLRDDGLAPRVVIVGDGPARESLERRAKTAGLENVTFLGALETDTEVFSLMKSSRIFALPSSREGFGLAALEASASGLPVVTSNHPHNAAVELVRDRACGLCSVPSPEAFAALIRRLLENEALRRSLSDNALKVARDFDWPRMASIVEHEYLKALHSDSSRSIPTVIV